MLTGKIIFLSAILFFVLLFLCICCNDSYAMWRRIQAQTRPWIIPTPSALAPAPRHQKSGDLLRSLKVLKWKSVDCGMPLQECAICLGELVEGDKVRILPECRHAFHLDCIDMWLHSHPTCPLCRNTLKPDHHQSRPTNVLFDVEGATR